MILVTVGTEKFPFDRLMVWVSILIEQKYFRDKVIVQYGSCRFIPKGAETHKLLPAEDFRKLAMSADLVIGHCGEGTLLLAEKISAPYILVPRISAFHEHVDNHQLELASKLEETGVPIAFSLEQLLNFLECPRRVDFSVLSMSAITQFCNSLEDYSNSILEKKSINIPATSIAS